jgi:hypothetical protein
VIDVIEIVSVVEIRFEIVIDDRLSVMSVAKEVILRVIVVIVAVEAEIDGIIVIVTVVEVEAEVEIDDIVIVIEETEKGKLFFSLTYNSSILI